MKLSRYALLACAFLIGGLQSDLRGADAQSLKIPYVSLSPTAGPLWIAYETGLFKRNGINAELLYIPGGSTIIQAIISGESKSPTWLPLRRLELGQKASI